jgi:hypothetical protein
MFFLKNDTRQIVLCAAERLAGKQFPRAQTIDRLCRSLEQIHLFDAALISLNFRSQSRNEGQKQKKILPIAKKCSRTLLSLQSTWRPKIETRGDELRERYSFWGPSGSV